VIIVGTGSGANLVEFVHFFGTMGNKVTIIKRNDYLVPNKEPGNLRAAADFCNGVRPVLFSLFFKSLYNKASPTPLKPLVSLRLLNTI